MLRTKIVCTLGPASDTEATIRAFLEAGMAAARINFSHGNYEAHTRRIQLVRRLAGQLGQPVAILADLQGPKLRVGLLPEVGLELTEGETVTLLADETTPLPSEGKVSHISDPHPASRRATRLAARGPHPARRWVARAAGARRQQP